jgi:hypothetical protein
MIKVTLHTKHFVLERKAESHRMSDECDALISNLFWAP